MYLSEKYSWTLKQLWENMSGVEIEERFALMLLDDPDFVKRVEEEEDARLSTLMTADEQFEMAKRILGCK